MDAAFVVFHCGSRERIGIRHPSTQTLYLSEVIDVHNSAGPGYGKLQTGLYLSMLHDVLDRTAQAEELSRKSKRPKRRRPTDNTSVDRKRPRTRAAVAKQKAEDIECQTSSEVTVYFS